MKALFLTLLTITTLSSISFGQAPPNNMVITKTNTNTVVDPTNTWFMDYSYNPGQTTTNATNAVQGTVLSSQYRAWWHEELTDHYPSGTKYHTYNSASLVESGALAGAPKKTLHVVEFPDGTFDVLAIRDQRNDGTSGTIFLRAYFVTGSPGTAPTGDIYYPNWAIVYPGGGFGPIYTPSMALPLASTIDLVALQAKATDLGEGLEFLQGYWRPINP